MFDIVQRIVEGVGLVTLLALAYHAGIMHNRVSKLEEFVRDTLPKMFDGVADQFRSIDGKLDKIVNMIFAHVSDDKTREIVLAERNRAIDERDARERKKYHDEMDES